MELRHLRSFAVLAEELHFGRAAARLRVAQPALTQQIKALEALFGAELFCRNKRSVAITPAGALILEQVRVLLKQADHTRAVAEKAGRGELGSIEIGFVGSCIFTGLIARALSNFRRVNPQVNFNLNEIGVVPQLRALDEGSLDVGFLRPPVLNCPPSLRVETIQTERILLAAPDSHPLARSPEVRIADFAHDLFIVPSLHPQMGFYAQCEAIWRKAGFRPDVIAKTTQFATICSLVAAGVGVALMPESLQRLQLDHLRFCQLRDVDQLSELAIVFRHDETSPTVRSFIEVCLAGRDKDARPAPSRTEKSIAGAAKTKGRAARLEPAH